MLNSQSQLVRIAGPVGNIDCSIDLPVANPRGVALIAHPHPLYGGTRDNKVVQTLARALLSIGFICWCPNFRGVGESEGQFDDGNGESKDLLTLVEHALAHPSVANIDRPVQLVLAGFSFGSFVQAKVFAELQSRGVAVARMILVGTAVSRFEVPNLPPGTVLIHGETDDVVPLSAVLRWAERSELPVTVIAGADHFFHRKLGLIKQIVLQTFSDGLKS